MEMFLMMSLVLSSVGLVFGWLLSFVLGSPVSYAVSNALIVAWYGFTQGTVDVRYFVNEQRHEYRVYTRSFILAIVGGASGYLLGMWLGAWSVPLMAVILTVVLMVSFGGESNPQIRDK